ncbi:MAG: hypothetical protein JXO49_10910 [Deltaproteobacteria bacterium]|nr:hypothetical protein [Candidatus Anaeroferrophillus wilburensis]MBN2889842.1 hypothetical protein [Deltaproteobacteria bacterium]
MFVVFLVAVHCPLPVSATEPFDFNNLTDAQSRQIFQPQMVSADDVREGKINQRTLNISKMLSGDKDSDEQKYVDRLAKLEQQVYQGAGGPVLLRPKAGILCSATIVRHPALDEVLPQVGTILHQAGFVPVATEQMQTVLNAYPHRLQLQHPAQISRFLAEYPGTRYLFFLQSIDLPGYFPGQLRLSYLLADGATGQLYPEVVVSRPVAVYQQLAPALYSCFMEMAGRSRQLTAAAPWQGMVFLVQGPVIYVSAGQYSGLQPGQILQVNGVLQPIREPRSGQVVGMVPGPPKALLRVRRFFGYDLAEVVVVQGGGVQMGDVVAIGK